MLTAVSLLLVHTLLIVESEAAEWLTSSGQHCVDACVLDPQQSFYRCHIGLWKRAWNPQMELSNLFQEPPWDYCSPQQNPLKEESNGDEKAFLSGSVALSPATPCAAACLQHGWHRMCVTPASYSHGLLMNVTSSGQLTKGFYCSLDIPLDRVQLTSRLGLWCIDHCRRTGGPYFWCNTLFGPDFCSPSLTTSSTGDVCFSKCHRDTNKTFKCFTRADNRTWSPCGYFVDDHNELEMSDEKNVCASICDFDNDQSCDVVLYKKDENEQKYRGVVVRERCSYSSEEKGLQKLFHFGLVILGLMSTAALVYIICTSIRAAKLDHMHVSEESRKRDCEDVESNLAKDNLKSPIESDNRTNTYSVNRSSSI